MVERARRLLRDIDLAVLEPFDEFIGRNVDDLDLGHFEHMVRHRFAHAHPREGGDHVVEALDMLDVNRREDVDPGREQFLHVLIALGMTAARGVGVRQLVDEHQRRMARQDSVDVHLGDDAALIFDILARHDLMPARQRFRFGPAMRLDHADHDVHACAFALHAVGEHLIGLADARCCSQEHLETATAFLRCLTQEGLWAGPIGYFRAFIHPPIFA